ncbi:hypothetical protein KIPB_011647, partial [Kipferlia bialata]
VMSDIALLLSRPGPKATEGEGEYMCISPADAPASWMGLLDRHLAQLCSAPLVNLEDKALDVCALEEDCYETGMTLRRIGSGVEAHHRLNGGVQLVNLLVTHCPLKVRLINPVDIDRFEGHKEVPYAVYRIARHPTLIDDVLRASMACVPQPPKEIEGEALQIRATSSVRAVALAQSYVYQLVLVLVTDPLLLCAMLKMENGVIPQAVAALSQAVDAASASESGIHAGQKEMARVAITLLTGACDVVKKTLGSDEEKEHHPLVRMVETALAQVDLPALALSLLKQETSQLPSPMAPLSSIMGVVTPAAKDVLAAALLSRGVVSELIHIFGTAGRHKGQPLAETTDEEAMAARKAAQQEREFHSTHAWRLAEDCVKAVCKGVVLNASTDALVSRAQKVQARAHPALSQAKWLMSASECPDPDCLMVLCQAMFICADPALPMAAWAALPYICSRLYISGTTETQTHIEECLKTKQAIFSTVNDTVALWLRELQTRPVQEADTTRAVCPFAIPPVMAGPDQQDTLVSFANSACVTVTSRINDLFSHVL